MCAHIESFVMTTQYYCCVHKNYTNILQIYYAGLSDPYVYIQLKPTTRFQIEAVQTEYKKKTLNPTYFKQFDM